MQDVSLSVDGLLSISSKHASVHQTIDVGIDIGIGNLILVLQIVVVHPGHRSLDASLEVLLNGTVNIPSLELSLGQQELYLG